MLYIATPMKLGPALALAPARPSVIMMSEGTMAQTYNKAGTTVGSHGPLSADEVASVAIKLKELVANNPDLVLPERSFMEDEQALRLSSHRYMVD